MPGNMVADEEDVRYSIGIRAEIAPPIGGTDTYCIRHFQQRPDGS